MAENRKYRIRVDGILVDVSEEVYHAYYSMERHTRTLDEKDIRNGKVLYSDLDTDELLGEEMLPNRNAEQVEDSAICRVLREKLHHQLAMLSAQDMELIQALYFECLTEREYAQRICFQEIKRSAKMQQRMEENEHGDSIGNCWLRRNGRISSPKRFQN